MCRSTKKWGSLQLLLALHHTDNALYLASGPALYLFIFLANSSSDEFPTYGVLCL